MCISISISISICVSQSRSRSQSRSQAVSLFQSLQSQFGCDLGLTLRARPICSGCGAGDSGFDYSGTQIVAGSAEQPKCASGAVSTPHDRYRRNYLKNLKKSKKNPFCQKKKRKNRFFQIFVDFYSKFVKKSINLK